MPFGLDRIVGYKSAKNIGTGISERIREAISRITNLSTRGFPPLQNEDLSDSLLYEYLTLHKPQAIKLSEEFLYSVIANSLELTFQNESQTPPARPKLEEEIVELLKREGDIAELSIDAYKHLLGFLVPSWDKLQKLLNLITVITLLINLYNLIENPSSSKSLRTSINSYQPEMKEIFSGSSVVSGNDVIVRRKPNKTSEELGRLSRGALVENLEGNTSGWIRVKVDIGGKRVEGWIYNNYIIRL